MPRVRLVSSLPPLLLGCESAISPKRLAADPWCPRCIPCQQTADLDRLHATKSAVELLAEAA